MIELKGRALGLCVRDLERLIGFQNDLCKTTCGNLVQTHCNNPVFKKCSVAELNTVDGEGTYIFKNIKMNGQTFDLLAINNGTEVVTLFYPLGHKYEETLKQFVEDGLTQREIQILELLIAGETRAKISKQLKISENTVKTHIRNIYRKISWRSGGV